MGLVTTYWPLMMTGGVATLLQVPGWVKSAVDCRMNPPCRTPAARNHGREITACNEGRRSYA
jgi:hypothetical protein